MRSVSGLLSTHSGEYGGHRHGKHGDTAISLKSKIDKLERAINEKRGMTLDDTDGRFSDWTDEELENYAINGIKPEGKVIGPISYQARESISKKFDGWSDEDLIRYATTGIKPKESEL